MRIVFYKKQKAEGRKQKGNKNLTVLCSYGLTVLLSYVLTISVSYGQISTHEEPVSLTREIPALSINEQTQKIMPFLDMKKIELEDAEDNLNDIPPRFGYPHEVNFTLDNSGEWIELDNGDKIWRLQIYCPNATSINLLYDHFWLPEGAKYFIYSNDYKHQLGAFTSKNNKGKKEDGRGFSTGLTFGDNITLEYYLPKKADDMGIISVSRVVHGYRGLGSTDNQEVICFNCSHNLNTNVVCEPSFRNEKDAVVLVIGNGSRVFTGSLVNTTANEMNDKHYILTYWKTEYGYTPVTDWGFYWHYESYACKPNRPSNQPSLIYTHGASAVACLNVGHFALLKLDGDPGLEWDVVPYYLGWDRSGSLPTGENTIIHHPEGDIKKIVSTTSPVISDPYIIGAWEIQGDFYSDYFPIVPREVGSRGAPLLNSNRKLIGHYCKSNATGNCGPNDCEEYNALFGKFSWAWDNHFASDSTGRLRDWLDPLNTGAITLNGRRDCKEIIRLHRSYPLFTYHAVEKIISKQTIPSGVTSSYKAGLEIKLIDGFHAESGSTFHAKIEEHTECSSTQTTSFFSSDGEQNTDYAMENPNTLFSKNYFPPKFNLYPNPNPGIFQLETNFPLEDIANFKITNLLGVPVYETQSLASNTIQLSDFASGLHFVVVMLKNGSVLTQKMMVQR